MLEKTALSAVTATTTSSPISVANIQNIGISITSAGVSSGTGTLSIDVSNDGTSWETDVAFISSISTTPATRVVSLATSGDADTKFAYLGADFGAKLIRVKCTRATDGNYTVIVFGSDITT